MSEDSRPTLWNSVVRWLGSFRSRPSATRHDRVDSASSPPRNEPCLSTPASDRHSSDSHIVTIEFAGGPLDGFRQLEAPRIECEGLLAVPINTNVVRIFAGERGGRKRRASSVAIYEQIPTEDDNSRQQFLHLGPAAVEAFRFETWQG